MNWFTRLETSEFRDFITEDDSQENVAIVSLKVRDCCKKLQTRASRLPDNDRIVEGLTECVDNFEFLADLASGKETDWDSYGFDGDFSQWFNDYLSSFYDVCDEPIAPNTRFCFLAL